MKGNSLNAKIIERNRKKIFLRDIRKNFVAISI